jgi:excisionase family DNA binding protein
VVVLLTIPEAAQRLKIGVSTLRRYLRRRLLPKVVLPGGDLRVREQDLELFVDSRTVQSKNNLR